MASLNGLSIGFQDIIKVVLVLWLETELNDCEAVTVTPCLHLSCWVGGLQVLDVLVEAHADTLIEMVLLFRQGFRS